MLATCRSDRESPARSPGSSSTTALPSDPDFVTRVHFPGHGGRFAKGCSVPDPYDVLTIAAIADELSATIGNGRIQRIGLLDPRTIGAEIYAGGQRHYLIASANDRQPRIRLAPAMPSLDSALITPFGLLLRKHTRGGIILGIDQPPLERLVRLSIAKRQAPLKTGRSASRHDETEIEVDELDELDELLGHWARAILCRRSRARLKASSQYTARQAAGVIRGAIPTTAPGCGRKLRPRTVGW